jgi:hypothetical protein
MKRTSSDKGVACGYRVPKTIGTLKTGEFRITLNVIRELRICNKYEPTIFVLQPSLVNGLYEFLRKHLGKT